jgi:hypothetical protein
MTSIPHVALKYKALGFSVLPVQRVDKKPLIPWQEFQKRLPTEEEVARWWQRWPAANLAIVTGKVSGVVVLDVDGPEGEASLRGRQVPPTPTVLTGKGRHLYFRWPGFEARNFARKLPGLDFRGDGGYVVAPPSVHASGRRYRWADYLGIEDVPLAPCPAWLLELLQPVKRQGLARSVDDWRRLVSEGVTEGQRNDSIAALAGHLLRKYVDPLITLELCLAWNRVKCRPPLPDDEVAVTVDSVARLELKRREAAGRNG